MARQLAPLDKDGKRSPDGKIVLLSIGFSNPSIEFPGFQNPASPQDPDMNPRLVTVNGCVGSRRRATGRSALPYWPEVQQRLDGGRRDGRSRCRRCGSKR